MPRYCPPLLLTIGLLTGCAHFWTPAPDRPTPLKSGDDRRALAGIWRLALVIDSLEPSAGSANGDRPLGEWGYATLRITDTLASRYHRTVLATLDPSLDAVIGPKGVGAAAITRRGGMPVAFGGDGVELSRNGGSWTISLTPGVDDYGFVLVGTLAGDSVAGWWGEGSWGRTVKAGRFVMLRQVEVSTEGSR